MFSFTTDDACPDLPTYLKSFSGSGISDSRLKRFNWLHPRNYAGQGSLSEADTLSPYGTSVSSPRGDEWELIDHGPRKSIDKLWDEVFEYQQRIKAREQEQDQEQQHQQVQGHGQGFEPISEYVCADDSTMREEEPILDGGVSCTTSTTKGGSVFGNGSYAGLIDFAAFANAGYCCGEDDKAATTTTRRRRNKCGGAGGMSSLRSITQTFFVTIHASRKGCRTDRGQALQLLRSFS